MADNKFNTEQALARCLPMSKLQAVLSGKWKILILWYVAFYKVQRFGQLARRLEGVTQATLSKQLRQLEWSQSRLCPGYENPYAGGIPLEDADETGTENP